MCQAFELDFRELFFFMARKCFSKVLIAVIGEEMKLRLSRKIMQSIKRYSLLQNRFYDLWFSQRQPASVEVKIAVLTRERLSGHRNYFIKFN